MMSARAADFWSWITMLMAAGIVVADALGWMTATPVVVVGLVVIATVYRVGWAILLRLPEPPRRSAVLDSEEAFKRAVAKGMFDGLAGKTDGEAA
jgi:hypothetical protein